MKTINLYTFNKLTDNAQQKAAVKFARDAQGRIDIAKGILANTENYHFEFLEDGTRIQIVEG